MAAGKINLQANDGAVIGLVVPDGLTSGERQIALGANLSNFASYHLLQGNLAVSASTITQGFNTTLYTGNGSTQSITTGIDMATQWGDTAEEQFGGLVWLKSRSNGTYSHRLFNSVMGATKSLVTDSTSAEITDATGLTAFSSSGFSLGTLANINGVSNSMVAWNFQTTHRVSGTTNHGKAYTCHYNPYTGFTIIKYEGSGIAGHEMPHHLGRKLDFFTIKNLTTTGTNWSTQLGDYYSMLQTTNAGTSQANPSDSTKVTYGGAGNDYNASANAYIMYGWANSYFDKSNKLIGNYEIGVYQGTGVSGNKVPTRGKPAWVMIKSLTDGSVGWAIFDNKRNNGTSDSIIRANLSNAEVLGNYITFNSDGFTHDTGWDGNTNTLGGQYLYMVAYDTNSNGGGSFYEKTTDNAQLQAVNTIIPTAQGIDSNGAKNMIVSKNETITGISLTEGVNYVYWEND